jgi:hypothetical protein
MASLDIKDAVYVHESEISALLTSTLEVRHGRQ